MISFFKQNEINKIKIIMSYYLINQGKENFKIYLNVKLKQKMKIKMK